MAVKKLSEIANSPGLPMLTDTLVGVGGGTTDYQYTLDQIQRVVGAFPPVSQDPRFDSGSGSLPLFATLTGSDSNPGTAAAPFATIQHMINVAVSFSYENAYTPNLSIGPGTWNVANITLPEVFYLPPGGGSASIFGQGIGSTIITASNPFSLFKCQKTTLSDWALQTISLDCNTRCIRVFGSADIFCNQVDFGDSTNSGNMICIEAGDFGIVEMQNCQITATTIANFQQFLFESTGLYVGGLTLPAALTVTGAFISCQQNSNSLFVPSSITNLGGAIGPKLQLHQSSGVYTNNGLLSDIPGDSTGAVDVTSCITDSAHIFPFSSTKASFFAQQFSGIPTNTDISAGCWTVVKDAGNVLSWDPLTRSGGIVLSGGNLTAANPSSGSTDEFVFSTSKDTKVYYEVVVNTDAGGVTPVGIGFANTNSVAAMSSYLGSNSASVSYYDSGGVFYNSGSVATIASYTTGDNVSCAIDTANNLVWFRVNGGNWNNSALADPATGAGGISVSPLGGPVFAAADLRVTQGSQITAQFSSASWSFAAPAGYSQLPVPSGGGVYVLYNDAGTIERVKLGGISATIVTAALTSLGSQGSMTFVDGVLTAQTPAT